LRDSWAVIGEPPLPPVYGNSLASGALAATGALAAAGVLVSAGAFAATGALAATDASSAACRLVPVPMPVMNTHITTRFLINFIALPSIKF
jgi:hypothetical protein